MSVKTVPGYTIACDFPDCGATADDDGDYSFWCDLDGAWDSADYVGHRGPADEWFCEKHPAAWGCDIADGDAPPVTPFVLLGDDGDARLVAHLHAGNPCIDASICPTRAIEIEAAGYDAVIEVAP